MKKLAFALFIALAAQAAAAKVIVRVITFHRNISRDETRPEGEWRVVKAPANGWSASLGSLLDEVEANAGDGATVGIEDAAQVVMTPGETRTLLGLDVSLLSLTPEAAEMKVSSLDVSVPMNRFAVVSSDRHLVALSVMNDTPAGVPADPLRPRKGFITPPKVVHRVDPVYPEDARAYRNCRVPDRHDRKSRVGTRTEGTAEWTERSRGRRRPSVAVRAGNDGGKAGTGAVQPDDEFLVEVGGRDSMKKLAFTLFIALAAQAAAAKVIVRVITFNRNAGPYKTPEAAWRAVEPPEHGWPASLGALLNEVEARAGDGATVGMHDVARTVMVPGQTQTLLDTDVTLLSLTGDTAEMRVHSVDVRVPVNGIAVVGSDRHLIALDVMDGTAAEKAVDPLRIQKNVVTPPKAVSTVNPVYPEEARLARISGIVILECSIDAAGNVEWVHVLKGLPNGLTEAALEAVRQWHFEPATMDGKPVPVLFNLTTNFKLN